MTPMKTWGMCMISVSEGKEAILIPLTVSSLDIRAICKVCVCLSSAREHCTINTAKFPAKCYWLVVRYNCSSVMPGLYMSERCDHSLTRTQLRLHHDRYQSLYVKTVILRCQLLLVVCSPLLCDIPFQQTLVTIQGYRIHNPRDTATVYRRAAELSTCASSPNRYTCLISIHGNTTYE